MSATVQQPNRRRARDAQVTSLYGSQCSDRFDCREDRLHQGVVASLGAPTCYVAESLPRTGARSEAYRARQRDADSAERRERCIHSVEQSADAMAATPAITIELRRGATVVNVVWPLVAAADARPGCASSCGDPHRRGVAFGRGNRHAGGNGDGARASGSRVRRSARLSGQCSGICLPAQ